MAITKATTTEGMKGFIKPDVAQEYFQEARRSSVVQQLVRQVPLGANGVAVPVVTSKAKAGWVAEAGQKPATGTEMGIKSMEPKKLAAIAVVSAEVVRANPANFMNILREDIAEAFATAFDAATLHGTSTPFGSDSHVGATSKAVTLGTAEKNAGGIFADINAGLKLLNAAKKRLTGFVFDSTVEADFNGAVDLNGRPLFVDAPTVDTAGPVRDGRLLGRPALIGDEVGTEQVAGFGGDWSKAVWGVVGGINYDVSTEATVTINGQLTSLWEHNLVAIRAEAEYGWLLHDKDAFVKYAPVAG